MFCRAGHAAGISSLLLAGWSVTSLAGEWTLQAPPPTANHLNALWGSGRADIFVTGDAGTILHYDGTSWAPMTSGTTNDLIRVWGSGPQDVYAFASVHGEYPSRSGLMFRNGDENQPTALHYDGTGWSPLPDPPQHDWGDVWGSDAAHVYVAYLHGAVYQFEAGVWTNTAPGPGWGGPSGTIYGLWGSSPTDMFSVGESIYHFDGGSWHGQTPPDGHPVYLFDVWGRGPADVLAVGRGGMIARYDGASWSQMPSGTHMDLLGVWGTDTTALAVGDDGTILRLDGSTWSLRERLTTEELRAVWGSSADDVWAVGTNGALLHYSGSAPPPAKQPSAWTLETPPSTDQNLKAIWGSGPADVFAVGEGGTVLHFDGTGWTPMESGTTDSLLGVWGSGPGDMYAGLQHYDGVTWSALPTPPDTGLRDVWGTDAQDIFFSFAHFVHRPLGDDMHRSIWLFDGASWVAGSSWVEPFGPWRLWSSSAAGPFFLGSKLLRFDGAAWQQEAAPGDWPLSAAAMSGRAADDIFAAGTSTGVAHYDGAAWSNMTTGTHMRLFGVRVCGPNVVFAVGDDGTIVRYDGSAWSVMERITTERLWDVWGSSPDDVWAVGENGTILHHYVAPTPDDKSPAEPPSNDGSYGEQPSGSADEPGTNAEPGAPPVVDCGGGACGGGLAGATLLTMLGLRGLKHRRWR